MGFIKKTLFFSLLQLCLSLIPHSEKSWFERRKDKVQCSDKQRDLTIFLCLNLLFSNLLPPQSRKFKRHIYEAWEFGLKFPIKGNKLKQYGACNQFSHRVKVNINQTYIRPSANSDDKIKINRKKKRHPLRPID